jgi:hypothetical protein
VSTNRAGVGSRDLAPASRLTLCKPPGLRVDCLEFIGKKAGQGFAVKEASIAVLGSDFFNNCDHCGRARIRWHRGGGRGHCQDPLLHFPGAVRDCSGCAPGTQRQFRNLILGFRNSGGQGKLSCRVQRTVVRRVAHESDAVTMPVNRPANRDQGIRLASGTPNCGVSDCFAIATEVGIGQINEGHLVHEYSLASVSTAFGLLCRTYDVAHYNAPSCDSCIVVLDQ